MSQKKTVIFGSGHNTMVTKHSVRETRYVKIVFYVTLSGMAYVGYITDVWDCKKGVAAVTVKLNAV